ncbi:MAG: hypothetical protein U5R49_25490 [Deltaproteobacteria bacterium]|nr:hypothetical protein [Deltaproteobacteria bacterium]
MNAPEIRLDILIKKEDGYYSAHCLQFDILATEDSLKAAQDAIVDLCIAHIRFSYENNNMDYLFSPAPGEAWAEYYAYLSKKKCSFEQKQLDIHIDAKDPSQLLLPPFMIQEILCHDQPAW